MRNVPQLSQQQIVYKVLTKVSCSAGLFCNELHYTVFEVSRDMHRLGQNLISASKLMLMVLPSQPRISQAHCSLML